MRVIIDLSDTLIAAFASILEAELIFHITAAIIQNDGLLWIMISALHTKYNNASPMFYNFRKFPDEILRTFWQWAQMKSWFCELKFIGCLVS